MKRPVAKFPTLSFLRAVGMCIATLAVVPVVARAQTAKPASESTPAKASGNKANKKPKHDRPAQEQATATPAAGGPKAIPIPLIPGSPAIDIKIPEYGPGGSLLSQLLAAKATRIDDDHVEMQGMTIDLNHPDGKEDYHVTMPTSMFNLKTRIITSKDPVEIHTQDFELTGESMEFNTVERTGKLMGKVRMLIHNLKQLAGQEQPTPKPE